MAGHAGRATRTLAQLRSGSVTQRANPERFSDFEWIGSCGDEREQISIENGGVERLIPSWWALALTGVRLSAMCGVSSTTTADLSTWSCRQCSATPSWVQLRWSLSRMPASTRRAKASWAWAWSCAMQQMLTTCTLETLSTTAGADI